MSVMEDVHCISACRSSYEERGLKYRVLSYARRDNRRSSYEERGLKFEVRSCNVGMIGNRSSYEERGLKSATLSARSGSVVAPRMRSVD